MLDFHVQIQRSFTPVLLKAVVIRGYEAFGNLVCTPPVVLFAAAIVSLSGLGWLANISSKLRVRLFLIVDLR